MPLNQAIPARDMNEQQIHFLRKDFVFGDNGKVLTVGAIPAGSVILKAISGVHVATVFNAGTANVIDVGTTADDDLYGTDLSLLALGPVALDEAVSFRVASDTTITATLGLTGTAATTGAGSVIIAYIPNSQ